MTDLSDGHECEVMPVQVRRMTAGEVDDVVTFPSDLPSAADPERWGEEFRAGRLRPEWTWVAVSAEGQMVGRLLLWSRSESQPPVSTELLDVSGLGQKRQDVATALVEAAREGLGPGTSLPDHEIVLPKRWREDPVLVEATEWRRAALVAGGLSRGNERLQFAWDKTAPLPPSPKELVFRDGDDGEFLTLFEQAAQGSLDVTTCRDLESMTPADQAASDLEFYRHCPGDRSWWRVSTDGTGKVVGFVIPSATPYHRNVGYLAVLPEYRGRGHVDDLLSFATHCHADAGADRITATTDTVNQPMARAFQRAGYAVTGHRLVLSA